MNDDLIKTIQELTEWVKALTKAVYDVTEERRGEGYIRIMGTVDTYEQNFE